MDSPKRMLIAEDETNDILLMKIALEELSLEGDFEVVQDGQKALDFIYRRGDYTGRPEGNPELMILDMKLPKVSGLEVLREIRSDRRFDMVSVVVFSSSLDENDKTEALSLGANDFMIKPMSFDDFQKAIEKTTSLYLSSRI